MTETMDLCDRAVAALRAAGTEVLGQRIDRLSGKDGTVVRMMPPRTRATYFDGSRRIDCTLQVISKRLDPVEAADEWSRVQDRYFKQARACASDLGLTVTSRCRLTVPDTISGLTRLDISV